MDINMKKILFIMVLFFCLMALPAWAATTNIDCSTSTTTNDAITAATTGDTLVCTNDGTWASAVTVSGKSLIFNGNGHTITMSTGSMSLTSSGSKTVEVYGFIFNATNAGEASAGKFTLLGDRTGTIYIHGNTFYSLIQYILYVRPSSGALISNNTFGSSGTRCGNEPLYFTADTEVQAAMRLAVGFGANPSSTVDWPTVENNTFWMVAGTNPSGSDVFDSQNGGKVRFRYNTIHDGYIYTHGVCEGTTTQWGTQAVELYNNHWIMHNGVSHYAWHYLEGNTFRVHDNRLELWGTGAFDVYLKWYTQREDSTYTHQSCDGSKQYLGKGYHVGFCSGSTAGGSWYNCYTESDWCANVPNGDGNKGTCAKKLCSNAWTLCTNDGDCSGGGSCNRYIDTSYLDSALGKPASIYGSGQWVDASTAYVASEPIYVWNNNKYSCAADGSGCTLVGDMSTSTGATSTYTVLNTDIFVSAPSPNTLATCPDSRTGLTGSCNATAGTGGYNIAGATSGSCSGCTIRGGTLYQ